MYSENYCTFTLVKELLLCCFSRHNRYDAIQTPSRLTFHSRDPFAGTLPLVELAYSCFSQDYTWRALAVIRFKHDCGRKSSALCYLDWPFFVTFKVVSIGGLCHKSNFSLTRVTFTKLVNIQFSVLTCFKQNCSRCFILTSLTYSLTALVCLTIQPSPSRACKVGKGTRMAVSYHRAISLCFNETSEKTCKWI